MAASPSPSARRALARSALTVGALGVVFGDLGTSPLHTTKTVFDPGDPHPVAVSYDSVFGIISMILWSVVPVVTVTCRRSGPAGRGAVARAPDRPDHRRRSSPSRRSCPP
jgi:hypothetical protein